MSEANTRIVRKMYEAFARGDIPAVLGILDPGIAWREAENFIYADGNPYVGPEAVLEGVFARLGSEWDAFAALPERFLDAGDTVVVEGRYQGSYKATGATVDAQFAHVLTLRDGKIVTFQQYTDTAQVARAAGR